MHKACELGHSLLGTAATHNAAVRPPTQGNLGLLKHLLAVAVDILSENSTTSGNFFLKLYIPYICDVKQHFILWDERNLSHTDNCFKLEETFSESGC